MNEPAKAIPIPNIGLSIMVMRPANVTATPAIIIGGINENPIR
jgi:hypothetical protein